MPKKKIINKNENENNEIISMSKQKYKHKIEQKLNSTSIFKKKYLSDNLSFYIIFYLDLKMYLSRWKLIFYLYLYLDNSIKFIFIFI